MHRPNPDLPKNYPVHPGHFEDTGELPFRYLLLFFASSDCRTPATQIICPLLQTSGQVRTGALRDFLVNHEVG